MVLNIRINFIVYVSILFISCRSGEDNDNPIEIVASNKEERLELFLESPLSLNTSAAEQTLNNIKFHKSYILAKNQHFDGNRDSIIRASSNGYVLINALRFNEEKDSLIRISSNNDVVEILKNKYIERILHMRINSKGIKLNYGIYLGMTIDSFNKLFPLKINENYVASYSDEEFFEVKFIFDEENRELKEFNYLYLID